MAYECTGVKAVVDLPGHLLKASAYVARRPQRGSYFHASHNIIGAHTYIFFYEIQRRETYIEIFTSDEERTNYAWQHT